MKKSLLRLANWLYKHAQQQEGEQVKELYEYQEEAEEFGAEPISEDEYIEQNFQEALPNDTSDKILKANGFKTTVSKKTEKGSGSELGSGVYGTVWRGVYQGKPAAAKIILKSGGFQEADVWKKILNAAHDFPPELKKHLPEIYLIKSGVIDDSRNDEIRYTLIIMEELRQLDRNFRELLERFGSYHKRTIERLFKDEDFLYDLSKKLVETILGKQSVLKYRLNKLTPEQVFKLLYDSNSYFEKNVIKKNDFDDISAFNRNELVRHLTEKIKEIYNLDADDTVQLERQIYNVTDYLAYPLPLPADQSMLSQEQSWMMLPETKQYFEMLKLLQQYGISFDDQHVDNVMLGNDDNLKLIDVGGFHVL